MRKRDIWISVAIIAAAVLILMLFSGSSGKGQIKIVAGGVARCAGLFLSDCTYFLIELSQGKILRMDNMLSAGQISLGDRPFAAEPDARYICPQALVHPEPNFARQLPVLRKGKPLSLKRGEW